MVEGSPQQKELCKRVTASGRLGTTVLDYPEWLATKRLSWYRELVVGLPYLSLGPPEFYVSLPDVFPSRWDLLPSELPLHCPVSWDREVCLPHGGSAEEARPYGTWNMIFLMTLVIRV